MIPHEKALVQRLQNEKFVLFGVNSDSDPAQFRRESEKLGVTWPSIFCGGTDAEVPRQWGVSGWPTIYILDARGVIRFKDLRGEEMEKAVLQLLAEAKGELPAPEEPGQEPQQEAEEVEQEAPKGGSRPATPLIPPASGGD